MGKRLIKENEYPFTWLDELVEITLNPDKTNLEELKPTQLQQINERLPLEFSLIGRLLKRQAFCLYRENHIKAVAGHYDQAISLLQQQIRIHLAQYPDSGILRDTGQLLSDGLNELYNGIQQRYTVYLRRPEKSEADTVALKLRCRLSVDQIAIILKAADRSNVIVARSLSQVLRIIVPYLSTERFENVSWKSARSSTYKMEDNDKEVAIQTLHALINQIRAF
ncbi:hypothetical protein ACVW0P_002616 [Mucilaginibacter sp. UYNi724]